MIIMFIMVILFIVIIMIIMVIMITKGKFILFTDPTRAHWFSYHQLFDLKHMIIVTYFFRGNPLLFPISSKGSFICTFPQLGQHSLWWTSCGPLVIMITMIIDQFVVPTAHALKTASRAKQTHMAIFKINRNSEQFGKNMDAHIQCIINNMMNVFKI